MALIHILDKQTDEIVGTLNVGDYYDDEKHSSIDNQNTFDFVALKHFDKLQKRNRLLVQDIDGYFSEYVIEYTEQVSHTAKNIWSVASFLDLKKAKIIEPQTLTGATATTAAEFALDGTEWEVGRVDSTNIRTITIEEYTNPYSFLKRIASIFGLELRFRVVVDGNRIVGRFVDLLIPDTEFDGKEVVFGKDLVGLRRKEDSSRIVTALLGIGPEREDGTRLTVFVEDRDALQRWGRNGQHLIEVYEPETSDMDMTIERLRTLTENELKKRIEAVVEYECEATIIEHIYGKEHEKIRLGDTIRIKDEGYTPPLYLEARIQEINEKPSLNRIVSFKLGNYKEFQKEDLEAQIDTLKKLLAQKASNAKLIEVYETALQQAEEKANQAEQNAKEYADTQDSQVKAEVIQYAEQQAQQAEENAKEYTDDRLQNTVAKDIFESTVTDLVNNIAQKVDNTRFEQVESELRGIAEDLQHEVAEHAEALEEHGGKITKLETDVDEIEGKISTTITELQSLEETVSRHETQIEANAREIALKADKQELDLLSGTVSDISSELSVMAGKIEAKAERSELEKLENDVSKVSQDVSQLTIDVDGIKTNVSSISQTVSNHGTQISNINSTLTQHADMIASKVEKSEFDSVTNSLGNRIATVEQTAEGIRTEVSDIRANVYTKSEVDSAIGGIQVGGRNLLLNTSGERTSTFSGWQQYFKDIRVGEYGLAEFRKGGKFTIRGYIKNIEGTERVGLMVHCETSSTSSGYRQFNRHDLLIAPKSEGYFEFTFNAPKDDNITSVYIATRHDSGSAGQSTVKFSEVKLEKGNKATDWTPAPEDIDEKFTDIEGTLVSHSTKIEQNAQQIQLRATKAEVDTLTNRISNVEGELNLMPDKISSRIAETAIGLVGSNLIPNGSFELDHFGWESGGTIVDEGHSGSKSLRVNALSSGFQRKYLSKLIPVIPGRTYEISFWVKTSSDCNGTADNQKLRIGKKDGNLINQATVGWDGARTEWTRFSRLWTVPLDINEIQVSIVNNHTTGWVLWDDISIVDVTNENEVRQYAESQITQLAGQIELRATKTEVDALTGQVSSIQSQLTVMDGEISAKVDKNGIINAINVSTEGVKINADRIEFEGHVFGKDATFAGSIEAVDPNDVTGYPSSIVISYEEVKRTVNDIVNKKYSELTLSDEIKIDKYDRSGIFAPGLHHIGHFHVSIEEGIWLTSRGDDWSLPHRSVSLDYGGLAFFIPETSETVMLSADASGFSMNKSLNVQGNIYQNGTPLFNSSGLGQNRVVRFADGTQMCWTWINTTIATGFELVWWFRENFVDDNYVVMHNFHNSSSSNNYAIFKTKQLYVDRAVLQVVHCTSDIANTTQWIQFFAIGRWK